VGRFEKKIVLLRVPENENFFNRRSFQKTLGFGYGPTNAPGSELRLI
jgi:hypothetical protein